MDTLQKLTFLHDEDSANVVSNFLHSAMHGCFCLGLLEDRPGGLVMQRYNRWVWSTAPSWAARREVIPDAEYTANIARVRLLEDEAAAEG